MKKTSNNLEEKPYPGIKEIPLKYCKCETVVRLRSQNLKICVDCGQERHWPLDRGQPSLLIKNLKG